jgi:hypothetical protein
VAGPVVREHGHQVRWGGSCCAGGWVSRGACYQKAGQGALKGSCVSW